MQKRHEKEEKVIEMAKSSEYGLCWYSEKGLMFVSTSGDIKPIKSTLPFYDPDVKL